MSLNAKLGLPLIVLSAVTLGPSAAFAAIAPPTDIVATVPRSALRDLGRAPAAGQMRVALTLKYRSEEQLEALVEMQSDETSPLYRHYLSSAQFNAAFAPAPADYARTIGTLQAAGFRVVQTYPNRTVIDAVAPVSSVERFFGTQIHRVIQPGYGIRYANALPARVPDSLHGLVLNVDGLSTLALVHPDFARVHGSQSTTPKSQSITPNLVGQPLKGPLNPEFNLAGFGPLAFSQGYNLPQQHAIPGKSGQYYIGTGRFSGVVIDADFVDSDLSTFLSYFNDTRTGPATVRIPIDGGPPKGDGSGDSVETTLDVETIVSNAPGTALYVYEFPSFDNLQYITDAYNQVVSDNIVDTANSSFGGCDKDLDSSPAAWDSIAEQAAALGITFHASTGDDGSESGCTQAPASGPHFVAVGGTSLSVDANGNWTGETGWGGSGGGVSTVFALPAWQKGVKNVVATGRNTPDIAFDADPNTGAAFYYESSWDTEYDPLGGTSLASPIYGAAQTEIDQVKNGRFGLAGKKIFAFFKKNKYGKGSDLFFHDITSGSNGGYGARTGYDQVTGIGSIDVWDFQKKQ